MNKETKTIYKNQDELNYFEEQIEKFDKEQIERLSKRKEFDGGKYVSLFGRVYDIKFEEDKKDE